MKRTTTNRLAAAWFAFVVGLAAWDWNREFHDATLVAALEQALPPSLFRFGPCEWQRPWKGSGPAWRCGVSSNAPLDMEGLAGRLQAAGWTRRSASGLVSFFCRDNSAVRFMDLGSPPPFARAFDMHATRYHPGVAGVYLDEVALACRAAASDRLPRRSSAPPATPSPACAMFPEPLRSSCR